MSWQYLLWCGLMRKPVRTMLTIASVTTAFLLFGLLAPMLLLFQGRGDYSGATRLIVQPRHSIADFLPVSAEESIRNIPGVRATAHQTWFGGTFRKPEYVFARWAVPAASYLALRPELLLSPAQKQAFLATRTGAIIGVSTAEKYGLKIGDHITLVPDIWNNKDGKPWDFELVGIYRGADRSVDVTSMYINYAFFDSYRAWGSGQVSFMLAALDTDANAADVSARIDKQFANSADETATSSERDYALAFADQLGNIGLMLSVVLLAVVFTIATVTANTMSQSVRERTSELATLRALGFRRMNLSMLLVAEALSITLLGACLGLLAAQSLLVVGRDYVAQLTGSGVGLMTSIFAALLALVLALIGALPPLVRLQRMRIVDALRRS